MMRLHAHKAIQRCGTDLLALLLAEPAGRAAVDAIPGGLDWLCQGPAEGNALIHGRAGPLFNPGWAVGDMPHATGTALERLLESTSAFVGGAPGMGVKRLFDAIAADELGDPTEHSVHAHYELAVMASVQALTSRLQALKHAPYTRTRSHGIGPHPHLHAFTHKPNLY